MSQPKSKSSTFHAPFLHAARHELSKKAKETVLIYEELLVTMNKQAGLSETLMNCSKSMSTQDLVLSRTNQNLTQIKDKMNELHAIVDEMGQLT